VARGGTRSAGLTRLRRVSRGSTLLGLAILAVFVALAVNIPETVRESHQRRRDRDAFVAWANDNGGRRSYGVAVTETHARYDIVCSPHFVDPNHRHQVDYRIYVLVDSHGSGTPRVVRAVRGPLKVKPTSTGPKCGAMPAAP
jgi:hypothetical protein